MHESFHGLEEFLAGGLPPEGKTCGLCGHTMTLDRCGYGSVWTNDSRVTLCHTDDHDCYRRWTVYRERPAVG
jgi:hypothetical protein